MVKYRVHGGFLLVPVAEDSGDCEHENMGTTTEQAGAHEAQWQSQSYKILQLFDGDRFCTAVPTEKSHKNTLENIFPQVRTSTQIPAPRYWYLMLYDRVDDPREDVGLQSVQTFGLKHNRGKPINSDRYEIRKKWNTNQSFIT